MTKGASDTHPYQSLASASYSSTLLESRAQEATPFDAQHVNNEPRTVVAPTAVTHSLRRVSSRAFIIETKTIDQKQQVENNGRFRLLVKLNRPVVQATRRPKYILA